MLRTLTIVSALMVALVPARLSAGGSDVTGQDISMIRAVLAELKCRFGEGDVTKEGDEFVLVNAFCASGQFDFRFDAKFTIIAQTPH